MPIVMAEKREDKICRMDLRMTSSERAQIERAAALKGQTLTQWSMNHLLEDSRRDIEASMTTWLSEKSFEEFAASLDEPMPKQVIELLARDSSWD